MKTTYLDYYKMILEKVSFDYYLFKREFEKAKSFLNNEEKQQLCEWLEKNGMLTKAKNYIYNGIQSKRGTTHKESCMI